MLAMSVSIDDTRRTAEDMSPSSTVTRPSTSASGLTRPGWFISTATMPVVASSTKQRQHSVAATVGLTGVGDERPCWIVTSQRRVSIFGTAICTVVPVSASVSTMRFATTVASTRAKAEPATTSAAVSGS